ARAEAAMSASQRLQGRWLLLGFQPEIPLEPALQLLLDAQIGHLVVEITGNNINAQGIGISVTRTYRIDEAYADHFKMTAFDAYGVGIESSGDFSGNLVLMNGITPPWRGRATFQRL